MKPCCEQMAEMIEMQGQRLFSAYLPKENPTPVSVFNMNNVPHLIFRSFDIEKEDYVRIVSEVPVSVEGRIGFKFCPWCGTALVIDKEFSNPDDQKNMAFKKRITQDLYE
ncbi:MAG: hypothetical protein ACRYFS_20000 [Janthinobacterium lividum]